MKLFNRIIALLLCIAMMSAVACLSVSAITLLPVGDWVYHEINGYTEAEVYEYNGTNKNVFTPYSNNLIPITTIGANAFEGNTTMEKLTLSKYITTVCHHAFMNCTALNTVTFQGVSVTTIEDYAFAGCSSLVNIALENTLIDTVSQGTFNNCDSLTEITLPETVESIDDNAFAYCDNLAKITIPASVTQISEDAFLGTPNVVIYCYEDSAAHVFAETNSIEYVLLEPPVTYILGDVDNSGDVAIMDATEVQLLIAQLVEPQDEYTQLRADIDSDGVLSIMDATSIQMFIADIEVEYPIGETFEV